MTREEVFTYIDQERDSQEAQWGREHDLTHSNADWFMILSIIMRKLHIDLISHAYSKEPYGKHIVQLAAVAVAWLELSDPDDIRG